MKSKQEGGELPPTPKHLPPHLPVVDHFPDELGEPLVSSLYCEFICHTSESLKHSGPETRNSRKHSSHAGPKSL